MGSGASDELRKPGGPEQGSGQRRRARALIELAEDCKIEYQDGLESFLRRGEAFRAMKPSTLRLTNYNYFKKYSFSRW